jgi:anti-sigma B factor antagonist
MPGDGMSELAGVRVASEGDIVLARVDGELDLSNTRVVARELMAGVSNDALGMVLDLSEVEYLDSSGVQMLFELTERLISRQQQLAVVVPSDSPLRRVIEIVSLDDTVPVVLDRDPAFARLR